jgi:hypothetical protein
MERIRTLVLSTGIFILAIAAATPGDSGWNCRWDGTAPACDGKCRPGERNVGGGGGAKALGATYPPIGEPCFTGRKELCCTEVADPKPVFGGWSGANIDRPGGDYKNFDLNGEYPSDCRDACSKDQKCQAWTYVRPGVQGPKARCWLKASVPPARPNNCCISDVIVRDVDIKVH